MKRVGMLIFGLVLMVAISGFVVAENETNETISDGVGCCSVSISGASCVVSTAEDCADDSLFAEDALCSQTSFCQTGCCYDEAIGVYDRNTLEANCEADWTADSECDFPGAELGCCVLGNQVKYETLGACELDSDVFALPVDFRDIKEVECLNVLEDEDTMSVDINKGWNLIYGFVDPEQITDGNIDGDDIKAIYALMPNTQEYARAWPDPEWEKLNTMDDDDILNSGMWVYSDESGYMTYSLYSNIVPFDQRQIYSGWNFVGISPDMMGHYASDLVGSCNILRSYEFDSNDQDWEGFQLDVVMFDNQALGKTWVIYVEDNCNLGRTQSIIPSPPVLPVSDDDLGNDEPLEIEGYKLVRVDEGGECDNDGNVEICMTVVELNYEDSFGERLEVILLDFSTQAGLDRFKDDVGDELFEANIDLPYVYSIDYDGGLAWFSDGKYDLVVIEGEYLDESNPIVSYFYDKYPGVDGEIVITDKCRDSDGGQNYFVKGTATGDENGYSSLTDFCAGGSGADIRMLAEAYCSGNSVLRENYICPSGCSDGACILDEAYDSDGGVNYEEKGTCVGRGYNDYIQTYTDNCGTWYDDVYNPNMLIEFRTGGENEGCWYDEYECPGLCVEGACVKGDVTPPVIVAFEELDNDAIDLGNAYVVFYVNEVSECRWSKEDKNFEDMENSIDCQQDINSPSAKGYLCSIVLTDIQEDNNDYYFRCKDQPWAQESERNTNVQSYHHSLIGV